MFGVAQRQGAADVTGHFSVLMAAGVRRGTMVIPSGRYCKLSSIWSLMAQKKIHIYSEWPGKWRVPTPRLAHAYLILYDLLK